MKIYANDNHDGPILSPDQWGGEVVGEPGGTMSEIHGYRYLLADYWSPCRLLFVKDPRKLRADWIYGQMVGEDARTPAEIAADFDLPLEAVHEVVHYCTHHAEIVREERERELERSKEFEKLYPPLRPPDYQPES